MIVYAFVCWDDFFIPKDNGSDGRAFVSNEPTVTKISSYLVWWFTNVYINKQNIKCCFELVAKGQNVV